MIGPFSDQQHFLPALSNEHSKITAFETLSIQNKKCSNQKELSFTNRSFPLYLIMAVESVNYDCAVRGYHVYKSVWEPKERQFLSCSHEENDIYDMFAIKTCLKNETGKEQIVGHLPLELPRFTKENRKQTRIRGKYLSRFQPSHELLQERKKNLLVKIKNTNIRKWFKKKETSAVVKDNRKAEKDKTVVVID